MAYKSYCMVMILVLLYMPLVVAVEAADANSSIQGGKVSFSTCMQQCMSICLKIKNANDSLCQEACAPGCKQLQGKGSIYGVKKHWKLNHMYYYLFQFP